MDLALLTERGNVMKVHSGDNPYSYQRQPSVTDLPLVSYELGTAYCLSV